MPLALIVAVSENGVIGVDGNLPWRMAADLRRFRQLTMGHHLIMGRKTFESIGRLLPGRTTVVLTRQADFQYDGAIVVHSISAALEAVKDDELSFVVGGAEIYSLFLPCVEQVFLTRVHTQLSGDTHFPTLARADWQLQSSEFHFADENNAFDFSFEVYSRSNGNQTPDKGA